MSVRSRPTLPPTPVLFPFTRPLPMYSASGAAAITYSQLSEAELADQGITPSTIRLSIGAEHIDDILADLEKGFAAVR